MLYPIIAGQIGVAVCERHDNHNFKSVNLKNPLVISIPENAKKTKIKKPTPSGMGLKKPLI